MQFFNRLLHEKRTISDKIFEYRMKLLKEKIDPVIPLEYDRSNKVFMSERAIASAENLLQGDALSAGQRAATQTLLVLLDPNAGRVGDVNYRRLDEAMAAGEADGDRDLQAAIAFTRLQIYSSRPDGELIDDAVFAARHSKCREIQDKCFAIAVLSRQMHRIRRAADDPQRIIKDELAARAQNAYAQIIRKEGNPLELLQVLEKSADCNQMINSARMHILHFGTDQVRAELMARDKEIRLMHPSGSRKRIEGLQAQLKVLGRNDLVAHYNVVLARKYPEDRAALCALALSDPALPKNSRAEALRMKSNYVEDGKIELLNEALALADEPLTRADILQKLERFDEAQAILGVLRGSSAMHHVLAKLSLAGSYAALKRGEQPSLLDLQWIAASQYSPHLKALALTLHARTLGRGPERAANQTEAKQLLDRAAAIPTSARTHAWIERVRNEVLED